MDKLIKRLIQIVVEKQQSNPHADVTELANDLKAAVESDPNLARLVTDSRIVQINQGDARAFQTLVNGGIANIGTHVHSDPEALKDVLGHFFQKLHAEPIKSPPLTRQEYRNRQALLTKVKKFWIKDVLEKSLYNQVLIELGLEEQPDIITNPWNVIREIGNSSSQPLSEGTKVIDIFDSIGEGRTLLILGKPGAGKTTTLLELTRNLITRAEQDINLLIPAVFNLSSWVNKRQTIADWLVEELNIRYDVPKKIGQAWVTQQQLLPLLDGLDEVKAKYREECLTALNQFKQEYGAELVVCSRIEEYKSLSNRLNFQSAVYLKPLIAEQVFHYLDSVSTDLATLRALIEKDTALQELANSPLILHIMILAYKGVAVEDLPKTEVVEEWRKQLFDAYIERMFHRPIRLSVEQRYSEEQTKHWLIWLAQSMDQESQTVFSIEGMQPFWLPTNGKRILYRIGIFLIGLLISAPFLGLGGIITVWGKAEIKTVETLQWSWKDVKKSLVRGLIIGLIVGLIVGLLYSLDELRIGLIYGPISGLYVWLIFGLFFGLVDGLKGSAIEEKTIPNQGIRRTAWSAVIIGSIILLIMGPFLAVTYGLGDKLSDGQSNGLHDVASFGLGYGLFSGVIALILGGGKACIQHFTMRLILCFDKNIPWNYSRFLDYAAERFFLQKVGGGYIFIHRLLLEHFADKRA